MKKLMVGLLLLAVQQGAFAKSIVGSAISFERVGKIGKVNHALVVYQNGTVVDFNYQGDEIEQQLILRLTRDQLNRINRLVNRSTPEVLKYQPSKAFCFAPAFENEVFRAMNATVLLQSGNICDGFDVNTRPAAKKLVNVLMALEKAAHTRQAIYQIEEEVDELLN